MKTVNNQASACRHCRYYLPEGRRGGVCEQLNAPVQSNWKACSLALPPFAPSWESIESLMAWQKQSVKLKPALQLDSSNTDLPEASRNIPPGNEAAAAVSI